MNGAYHHSRLFGLAEYSQRIPSKCGRLALTCFRLIAGKELHLRLTNPLGPGNTGFWKKVPFYCTAWSNLFSVLNAIKAGSDPHGLCLQQKTRRLLNG